MQDGGFYSVWLRHIEGLPLSLLKRYFCITSLLDEKGNVLHQYYTQDFGSTVQPNLNVRFIFPSYPNAYELKIEVARLHKGAGLRVNLKQKHLLIAYSTIKLDDTVRICADETCSEYFEFSTTDEQNLTFVDNKDTPFSDMIDDNLEPIPSPNCILYYSLKKLLIVPTHFLTSNKFNGVQHTWKSVSDRPGKLFQRGTLDLVFHLNSSLPNSYKKLKVIARTDTQFLKVPYNINVAKNVRKYCDVQSYQLEDTPYQHPRLTFVIFQHQFPKCVEITLQYSTKTIKKDKKKYLFLLNLQYNHSEEALFIQQHDKLGVSNNLLALDQPGDQLPNLDLSVSSYINFWDESNLENHWGKNDSMLTEDFYSEYEFSNADNFKERFYETHPKEIVDNLYVLFVRGLLCNYYATYYVQNLKRVADLGLPSDEIKIDTNMGCTTNAKVIAESIQAKAAEFSEQGKNYKFIIFAHSKGVADVHVAITLFPDIRSLLYGVIAMQGVHYGTPSYETFQMNRFQSTVGNLLNGERDAFLDLSYSIRSKFAEEYPFPVDVPAISLATVFRCDSGPGLDNVLFDKVYSVIAKYIRKRTGYESDGLVIQADARVPNSDIILLEEMSHSHVASLFPGAKYTPGPITQTVISLLLRKVEGLSKVFSGKIDLIIESASDLAPRDRGNSSDPFVIVLRDNVKLFQTQVVKKTLYPVWNHHAFIRFLQLDSILKFNCYDNDIVKNDFEGQVAVSVAELLSGVEEGVEEYVKKSFPFQPKASSKSKDVITGQLSLLIRFTTSH